MNEQISALLDDEIAVEDAGHLIKAMLNNKDAAQAWNQYHLIGDVMRSNAVLSSQFKQNLMQKIDKEATVLAPNAALAGKVAKEIPDKRLPVSWSIAASFAAVMVVGFVLLNQQSPTGNGYQSIALAQLDNSTGASLDEGIPAEYLNAHQASAPSASSYYIQTVSYQD